MAISRHPALQVNVLVQNDLDLEMSVPDVPPNTPVTGVNVGVNMNMNMPRIVVSREDGHEEKMEESEIERGDDGMVVVGISGATSSGKTTLVSFLLSDCALLNQGSLMMLIHERDPTLQ